MNRSLRCIAAFAVLAALGSVWAGAAGATVLVRMSNGTTEGTGRLVLDQAGAPDSVSLGADLTVVTAWTIFVDDAANPDVAAGFELDPGLPAGACTLTDPNTDGTDNGVTCDMTDPGFAAGPLSPRVYLGDGATTSTAINDLSGYGIQLVGEGGIDMLTGGAGPDYLDGSADGDYLDGKGGNDTIIGGAGTDTVYGDDAFDPAAGTGDDTFYLRDGESDFGFCGGGTDAVEADSNEIDPSNHFNRCESISRPAVVTPDPNKTTIEGVTFAGIVGVSTAGTTVAPSKATTLKMPPVLRGQAGLIIECRARKYCDENEVVSHLRARGLDVRPRINAVRSPAGSAPGEVVGVLPTVGKVLSDAGAVENLTINVIEPAPQPAPQLCRAGAKYSNGAKGTLGTYLVGKDYASAKAELRDFKCYTKASGENEANVKYAIVTTVKKGLRFPEVASVADKKIDGSSATTLVVTMAFPPSQLALAYASPSGDKGPALTVDKKQLEVSKTAMKLQVQVRGTTGFLAPTGTEVSLRDPDGQLVDRGVTDAKGYVTLSGKITEPGQHELFASFADAEGDSISGYANISAVKSSSKPGFGRVAPSSKARSGRANTKVNTSCGVAGIDAPNADELAIRAAAMETFACKLNRDGFVNDGMKVFPGSIAGFVEYAKRGLAVQTALNYALGANQTVDGKPAVRPIVLASGNLDGTVPGAPIVTPSVPVLTSRGQGLQASARADVLSIASGTVAFRIDFIGATFLPNGGILWDSAPSTVSKLGVIETAKALTVIGKPNFNIVDLSTIFPKDPSGIVAGGAGNVVAAGAGNIVAGGAGNIVAGGAGNIVAGGAGNIVAGGAGNILVGQASIVAAGAGNIVAGGAGNIVAGGAGNIVAGGAGNIVAGGAGNIVAGGAGN